MFLNRHRLDYWVLANAGSVPFTPTSLFTAGVTGAWYNPADHTTTFQDAAGTTPANAATQPVRRVNDLSGNGNHLIIGAAQGPPILNNSGALWWLEFAPDFRALQVAFTFVQPVTRVNAALVPVYGGSNATFWDGVGAFHGNLHQPGPEPAIQMYAGAYVADATHFLTNAAHVVTEIYNGASSSLTVDNNSANTGDAGAGTIDGITVGGSGDLTRALNMNWYGGIFIGNVMSAGNIASCRTYFGNLAGLSL